MSVHSDTTCPDDVLASIAWYPDELDEARRGRVEAHLAQCFDCREELAFVKGDAEPELDHADLPDADAIYARVMARIERSEGLAPGDAPAVRAALRPRRAFGGRAAAAAAGIALAVALGGVGGMWLAEPTPGYTPATAPDEAVAPAGGALDVVFRPDARAESIQSALRGIGGTVVSGPTQMGVYRVSLSEGADLAAAAATLKGEGHGVATFAEPVAR